MMHKNFLTYICDFFSAVTGPEIVFMFVLYCWHLAVDVPGKLFVFGKMGHNFQFKFTTKDKRKARERGVSDKIKHKCQE